MDDGPAKASGSRRQISEEFRQDAVRLVTEQQYSFKAAAAAAAVCEKSLYCDYEVC